MKKGDIEIESNINAKNNVRQKIRERSLRRLSKYIVNGVTNEEQRI